MLAAALAICSSVSWGVSDFLGGLKSRTLTVLTVLLVSQGMGLVLIALVVAARGVPPPATQFLLYGALSAAAGTVGLASFYRGLAVGAMGVVAPISATAAAIPVAVGIATGERPSLIQGIGIVLAVIGVAVASREPSEDRSATIASGAGLALLAALGFGGFFLLMDRASDGDVFWAILANRVSGVALLVAVAVALRPRLAVGRGDLGALIAIAVCDISANALFAVASTRGLVSVVAVLASLYPVVTVTLARLVLHERVHAIQRAGAVGAIAGAALLAAG